jgi:CRISPR-associated protein Cas1
LLTLRDHKGTTIPVLSSCLIEPIWGQFAALRPEKPEFDPTHPLGCHRQLSNSWLAQAPQLIRVHRGRPSAVRRVYRQHSDRTGVRWSRRSYDVEDWDGGEPVNQALSAANAALYGIVHSVIVALGCSPALGFVHTGGHRSSVYDIADLYKAELTIPVAFDIAAEEVVDIGGEIRRRLRDALHDGTLLQRCARDIQRLLLNPDRSDLQAEEYLDFDVVSLWDEHGNFVPGGVAYGGES